MKKLLPLLLGALPWLLVSCGDKPTPPPPTPTIVVPTVISSGINNITQSSASSGGNVTSAGNGTVTERGVCYSTTPGPTVSNSKTSDGGGTGAYASNLTGLTANTVYYTRAYATNSAGTAYGIEVSFTTSTPAPVLPILTTTSASGVTNTSFNAGGNITSGTGITESGVCYGITNNPTTTSTKVLGSGNPFTVIVSSLNPGTKYYFKAYTINSAGTAYGGLDSATTTGFSLGQATGGGVVFWVDATATKALVSATIDLNPGVGAKWWPQGGPYILIGANQTVLGGGDFNTNIVSTHPQCLSTAATKICYDLVYNSYSDWYLGDKDEMTQLYAQRNLPGLAGTFNENVGIWHRYWTSSEGTIATDAWTNNWAGFSGIDIKDGQGAIRPIRKAGAW